MLEWNSFLVFLGSTILLAITPGPDILFVFTQGLNGNKKDALAISSGISIGNIIHTLLGSLGLSLLLKKYPLSIKIITILGAIYLIYLAYNSFLDYKSNEFNKSKKSDLGFFDLFKKGFIMNLFNPKVSLFFLAFFPSFIPSTTPSYEASFLLLGLSFTLLAFLIFSTVGYFSAQLGSILFSNALRMKRFLLISVLICLLLSLYMLKSVL